MSRKRLLQMGCVLVVFASGFAVGKINKTGIEAQANSSGRVFELRTYKIADGRLGALDSRFREHTLALFKKHGLASIGFFTPDDPALSSNTLIYILAHPSREAAKKNWDSFLSDPEWLRVQKQTELSGPIVVKIDSVYMNATNYSPLK